MNRRIEYETCPNCNGTKQIMTGYSDDKNESGHSFYIPCDECGGVGVIYFLPKLIYEKRE